MINKIVLTEQSIVLGTIPKILKFNKEDLKLNLLSSYSKNNYQSFDEFNYHKYYLNLDLHQHFTWLHDFIKDDYNLNYGKSLIKTSFSGILLLPNESIDYHHHVDDYDIHNSNDFTCVYVLEAEKQSSSLFFEYEQGRKRHAKWMEPLETNKYLLFNSELRHSYSKNLSNKPIYMICWTFQII